MQSVIKVSPPLSLCEETDYFAQMTLLQSKLSLKLEFVSTIDYSKRLRNRNTGMATCGAPSGHLERISAGNNKQRQSFNECRCQQ